MNSPFLGVDFGLARTGLALSESGLIASPLTVLEADRPHLAKVLEGIIDQVKSHEIRTIIVGLPYTEEGDDTTQSNRTAGLVRKLEESLQKNNLSVTVITVNEFYTSQEADAVFPDAPRDAAAAAVILQSYLDEHTS